MSKIIKRDGKFYRKTIEEQESHLKDLQEAIVEVRKRKREVILNQTRDFDDQITEIKDEIDQLKAL